MNLTDEEIRIKIAEACGWKFSKLAHPDSKPVAVMCWIAPGCEDWQIRRLPDYLNDLNAMHEAEKVLNPTQLLRYAEDLMDKLGSHSCIKATAAQRAEAFIKTLNLEPK